MKKQVILLMTDTTRKDMLGCYGDDRMKTPNLDRLAGEGIVMKMHIPVSLYVVPHVVLYLQVHFLIQMVWWRILLQWGQM